MASQHNLVQENPGEKIVERKDTLLVFSLAVIPALMTLLSALAH